VNPNGEQLAHCCSSYLGARGECSLVYRLPMKGCVCARVHRAQTAQTVSLCIWGRKHMYVWHVAGLHRTRPTEPLHARER
jgi:hypothetical protein